VRKCSVTNKKPVPNCSCYQSEKCNGCNDCRKSNEQLEKEASERKAATYKFNDVDTLENMYNLFN